MNAPNGWIPHDGKDCPVPAGTILDVRYRDGGKQRVTALETSSGWRNGEARFWDTRDNHHSDITAYRIIPHPPGEEK